MHVVSDEGWFVAALAAGAARDDLLGLWQRLGESERIGRILAMAGRAAILPAFASFLDACPPKTDGGQLMRAVALGLLSGAKLPRALTLLADVAARPEVRHTAPVAIKGAGLTLSGHYHRYERDADDVDLVVPPGAVRDWRRAAVGAGAVWTDLPPGPAGTYQVARIARGSAVMELHVALFGDASLIPGIPYEGLLPFTEDPHPQHGISGVRTPTVAAAREIAVHHFVFHHRGAENCGFQAIQDVARLARGDVRNGGASGLEWPGASPVPATALMRRVAARLQSEIRHEDEETTTFLAPLAAALEGGEPTAPSYAELIDGMGRVLVSRGAGGVARLFWTLFPPVARMRARPGEPFVVTAARYAVRPPVVLARYLRSRRSRATVASFQRWHRFVAEGGHRSMRQ